ncbi:hypothetical protein B0H14DRAFT_2561578 [Mycena olivaceomarginata]|nr:hypothetical protein B0H14DRAFT_2561578 [Mycena olivaceomarginata]
MRLGSCGGGALPRQPLLKPPPPRHDQKPYGQLRRFRAPHESDARRDERELSHQRRRRHAHQALERAQQRLRVAPPASRAHAVAEQERSRRLVLSLSGPPPTSSDEEVGRIPLGRVPEGTRRPAVDTSDDDYYSTSSTSSGGSSTRDLEAKAALWAEYQQRPADVISRFESSAPRARLPEDGADRVAETAAAGSRAPDDNVAKHEPTCRRLRARWAHCDCSCKQLRLARRQTRQQQCLGRWFSAQREEEGADDGDDEGDAPSNALPPSAV